MQHKINNVILECVIGDIAAQEDCEAVVNAANAELLPGGGVAGAIHRAAGPGLSAQCRKFAPINPGDAVITLACNLPNKYVIHCLGPVYGKDTPSDILLSNCYKNAMKLVKENAIKSIAFCAISTGIFHYPMQEASMIALRVIISALSDMQELELVRFVLHSADALEIYKRSLFELIS